VKRGFDLFPPCEDAMLSWLVDHANVVYFVLGAVVLSLLVSFWLKRRIRTLFMALAGLALIVVFWLLTVVVPTDRKQIEANLWAMARAVRDKKPDDLVRHWARDFEFMGRSRAELAKAVTGTADRFHVESINLWEFDWKSITADKAEVWFRCVANGQGGGTFLAIARANFVKEGDAWKLQRIRFFQPLGNTDQEIPIPLQ